MSLLRFLNPQGLAGLVLSLCVGLLLILQKGETRHWKKQSDQFEQLYRGEKAAFASTIANYRAAAAAAESADKANAERVAAVQRAINQRSEDAFETRLADARARAAALADQLRRRPGAEADPGVGANPPMPSLSAAAGAAPQGSGKDGLPGDDALVATEQAIQLEELIKWVRAQADVAPN